MRASRASVQPNYLNCGPVAQLSCKVEGIVAAALRAGRLEEMRQAFVQWRAQLRTDLGVAMPIDHLVTVGAASQAVWRHRGTLLVNQAERRLNLPQKLRLSESTRC